MARVDHILVSVKSLDAAMRRWADAGLQATIGGSHPGGTFNALVRGPQHAYVELIGAVQNPISEAGRRVLASPGPLSWALGVDDLDQVRRALRSGGHATGPVESGSRTTPGGETLTWRLCDIGGHALHEFLPFLIEWHVAMEPGPESGPTVTSVTLEVPDPARLGALLQVCGLSPGSRPELPADVALTDGQVDVLLRPGEGRITQASAELVDGPVGEIDLDGLRLSRTVPRAR